MAAMKRSRTGTIVSLMVLALAMAFVTWLVYLAGTDSYAVHFYYLPILWAAFMFGDPGAIIVSLIAGLGCGWWMPTESGQGLSSADSSLQNLFNMILRMLIFYVVGIVASRLSSELKRRVVEARTLYEVARSITSTLRIKQVLELITSHAMRVMDAKACNIRLLDEETGELKLTASAGLGEDYWQKGPVLVPGSVVDQRVLSGHAEQIYDVRTDPHFQYPEAARQAGLTSVLIVPLETKDKVLGVVRVYAKSPRRFVQREVDLLTAFAHQASVAIENAELYEDIRRSYYETVRTLTRAIEAKDSDTYSHSERVTDIVDQIAAEVGIPEEQRELLRFGSILHDVGKIGLDRDDLPANGEPGEPEQAFYRMHPLIGQSILAPVTFLQPVLSVVTHHHERWDGTGFPESLKGDAIPYDARIIAIADAYDRLINPHNPARQASLSPQEALHDILARAGSGFDPELVMAFRRIVMQGLHRTDSLQQETPVSEAEEDC